MKQCPALYLCKWQIKSLKLILVQRAAGGFHCTSQISLVFTQYKYSKIHLKTRVCYVTEEPVSCLIALTSYPVMAMRCMESLTALRMPKMEVSASCRSSAPSQLLLYLSISCSQ